MSNPIEWFRVVNTNTGIEQIICHACLTAQHKFKTHALLNRIFGASQTCALCGTTDKKETK